MSAGKKERLRPFLSRWLFSPLQGATLRTWTRALADNKLRVHPVYLPRLALTTLTAASNSLQARGEKRRFGDAIDKAVVERPVFILGHYRSGTTHLHNLLGQDRRLAFPNYYQATFPETFLSSESSGARIGSLFAPRKRPHDDVDIRLDVPTEDELALCAESLVSNHMGWHFPARRDHYRKFVTLAEASEQERQRWIASIRKFAKKLTVRHELPLVFKSPCHTARVDLILEAFPDARFVHIHRDPYKVFQSTRNMELKVAPLFQFQKPDLSVLDERIVWRYRVMYDAYLEQRASIPSSRLIEVSYSDLDANPLDTLTSIYEALDLPTFGLVQPDIERYLASLRGYKKNAYDTLEPERRQLLAREWGRTFDEWRYST